MYPIEVFPPIGVLVGAIVMLGLTAWVYYMDLQPAAIGLVAVPISVATSWCWFGELPEWTAWVIPALTLVLFIIGMLKPEKKDDLWHFGALVVALLGKALAALVPLVGDFFSGESTIPNPIWFLGLLSILVFGGIAAIAARQASSPATRREHPTKKEEAKAPITT